MRSEQEHRTLEVDKKIMGENRYTIHLTTSECGKFANLHTHGLENSYGHPDLQIVLNYRPYQVEEYFRHLISLISSGVAFEPQIYEDVFSHPIRFQFFRESGREVLRVIFADRNNFFPEDEQCDPSYSEQLIVFD